MEEIIERIKLLESDIQKAAMEINNLTQLLSQKNASIVSMKGGIIELQRLINESKKIAEVNEEEE